MLGGWRVSTATKDRKEGKGGADLSGLGFLAEGATGEQTARRRGSEGGNRLYRVPTLLPAFSARST